MLRKFGEESGINPILHHLHHSTFHQNCKPNFGENMKNPAEISIFGLSGSCHDTL